MQPLKEQEKTQLWLDQFDQRNDRQLAEMLLDSINYCPLNEFKNSLTRLIKSELPLKQPSALFIERELQKTRGTLPPPVYKQELTLKSQSKSKPKKRHLRAYGAAMQAVQSLRYTTQDVGSEGVVAFIGNTVCRSNPTRFLLQPTAENVRKSKVRNFVILTDFIGSGKRAFDMLDAMWNVASIRSWHSFKFVKFWVLAYSGTQQGITRVQKHRFAPEVRVVTECPTLFNSFDEDLDEMVELCETYGAHSSTPLGWERTAALLAFEHGAPNNMPAIFVSEKNTGNRRWAPLFPKRVTDNLWRSTEVNMGSITQKALEALNLSDISRSRRFQKASDETKSAMIVLLAYSQGKRRIAELRRVLPLSLDSLLSAKYLAQKRGWLTDTGALTAAGQKTIRTLRREGRKLFVADYPFASYYPQQLRAPQ
ncbi:hypothetical protein E3Z27_07485 [Pseudomonas mediterranea]|uniref:phosphoribosyltransferase-like protein n=1 Tax=Pseudomonas mediterranea TaxID=183795 RepID=UPI001315EC80|nr:hypothetical protein [Pseudomonas mediterranea]QHA81538.1 hypothetical protein E3Z27_07485 [Pseudomonas mediterranea]